jgi:ATP-binding cassette, subfamily F, member 3
LFHIIMGEIEPDSGSVARPKNLTIGYLPQQCDPPEEKTILAHTTDVDQRLGDVRLQLNLLQQQMTTERERDRIEQMALHQTHLIEQFEHLGGYDLESRAQKILAGLGFREDQFQRSAKTLSGGWLMRLELARLLLAEQDLLLLDEPTNHLDLESLIWLEEYLGNCPSAVIIISHDRAFLNGVVRRIVELEGGRFQDYAGNYDFYVKEKAQRREIQTSAHKNQQERIRQVERFIERNRYRKDRARQVQSRLKSLDKVERIEALPGESQIHFAFPDPPRSGKRVVELRNLHKSYGSQVVYAGVDLTIERGDRIAFLGKNGAGKSTLLKILAGVEAIDEGERILGHKVALGHYAQYQWEQLNSNWTVLEEAASIAGDFSQSQLRGLLGAFLFRGDDVDKKVAVLSGGEKARLILCKLLLQRPNVLLMDEPTNHLDIPSRDVLEEALRQFSGTLCFISHDRHFINRLAGKVLVIEAGQIDLFPGNFDDFQNIWKKGWKRHPMKGPNQRPAKVLSRVREKRRTRRGWRPHGATIYIN